MLGGLAATGLLAFAGAARATQTTANVVTDGGAVSGSTADQTPAFLRAFNLLPASGGSLYVPAGTYYLNMPLVLSPNATLSIYGDDSGLCVININTTGVAITIQPAATGSHISVKGLGFAGLVTTSGAIHVNMPAASGDAGVQSCKIDDINIIAVPNASVTTGLQRTNIWKSLISNVRMVGPSVVTGTGFITLNGFSIDNRCVDCYAEQLDVAFNVAGYSEGVRLQRPIVVNCNTGFTSGSAPNNTGANYINVLSLYIDGGEINCLKTALNAYQIWTGWINATHFATSTTNVSPTCLLSGCLAVNMVGCNISGSVNNATTTGVGIQLVNTTNAGCCDNIIDSCEFGNLSTAVTYSSGVGMNSAINIRLVSVTSFPHLVATNVVIDNSGNTFNQAAWVTEAGGSGRFGYLH